MRYIVKFTNGYWKTFDTEEYKDSGMFMLKKDAVQAAKNLNQMKGA